MLQYNLYWYRKLSCTCGDAPIPSLLVQENNLYLWGCPNTIFIGTENLSVLVEILEHHYYSQL